MEAIEKHVNRDRRTPFYYIKLKPLRTLYKLINNSPRLETRVISTWILPGTFQSAPILVLHCMLHAWRLALCVLWCGRNFLSIIQNAFNNQAPPPRPPTAQPPAFSVHATENFGKWKAAAPLDEDMRIHAKTQIHRCQHMWRHTNIKNEVDGNFNSSAWKRNFNAQNSEAE